TGIRFGIAVGNWQAPASISTREYPCTSRRIGSRRRNPTDPVLGEVIRSERGTRWTRAGHPVIVRSRPQPSHGGREAENPSRDQRFGIGRYGASLPEARRGTRPSLPRLRAVRLRSRFARRGVPRLPGAAAREDPLHSLFGALPKGTGVADHD